MPESEVSHVAINATNPLATHLHLVGRSLLRCALSEEHVFAVLVELELGDDNVGRVDGNGDSRAVRLLAVDPLDVDGKLLAVHLRDLRIGMAIVERAAQIEWRVDECETG